MSVNHWTIFRDTPASPYVRLSKVREWRDGMFGKRYSTIYRALASFVTMNTEWRKIFLRQDSRIIPVRQNTIPMLQEQQETSSLSSLDSPKIYSHGTNGEKPWDTTNPVVEWLESPEGEFWSRKRTHNSVSYMPPLVIIKDDGIGDWHAILWYG